MHPRARSLALHGMAVTRTQFTPLEDMPDEVLLCIMGHLRSFRALLSLALAYRRVHVMLANENEWRSLCRALADPVASIVAAHWHMHTNWRWVYRACATALPPRHLLESDASAPPCVGTVAYYHPHIVYCGEVRRGLPNGLGMLVFLQGRRSSPLATGMNTIERICGQKRPSILLHTELCYEGGQWLQGMWKDGCFSHGTARVSLYGGLIYEGAFEGGLPHGTGQQRIETHVGLRLYRGEWYKSMPHGRGILNVEEDDDDSESPTGAQFVGIWVYGRRREHGMWREPDGRLRFVRWSNDDVAIEWDIDPDPAFLDPPKVDAPI